MLCLCFFINTSFAQQLFFPAANYADSALLSSKMPGLARQVISRYQEANKMTYFDNLMRLELIQSLTIITAFPTVCALGASA